MVKKVKKWIFLLAIILLIAVFPYLRVEYLSYKHGHQFEELYKLTNMIDGICVVKVYEYSENYAKVYYVETGRLTGSFVYFYRDNERNKWLLDKWETVWSKKGSAEGFIWPYY